MEEMQDRQNSANSVETNCLLISNQQAISYLSGFVQIPMVKEKDLMQLFSRKVRNKVIVHYILPCSVRRNTGWLMGTENQSQVSVSVLEPKLFCLNWNFPSFFLPWFSPFFPKTLCFNLALQQYMFHPSAWQFQISDLFMDFDLNYVHE